MSRPLLLLQVDGTPGVPGRGTAGLGVVVRDTGGAVLHWSCATAPAQTCNEAEYQALIAGLELLLRRFPGAPARCLTDSRLVVEQMSGRAAVRAGPLVPLHARASALARQIGRVSYVAVPRELNRLADALAWEALDGRGWLIRTIGHEPTPQPRQGRSR